MSFEVIDNAFQVILMLVMMLAAFIFSIRKQNRLFLILSLAYACFMMGTLYYVLYLALTGHVPQVFYVAEISWLASYMFFLSLQIVRTEQTGISFSVPALLYAIFLAACIMIFEIFGPSRLMSLLLAVTVGVNAYLSWNRIQHQMSNGWLDRVMLICLTLQVLLYIVSIFMSDYTHFNLYFVIDIALSCCFAALLPLTLREVHQG